MFCKECGKEIKDVAVICVSCGSPTDNFAKKEEKKPASNFAVGWGYACAFLLPPGGIILGIYCMAKNRFDHGIMITGLSLFLWATFAAMLGGM